MSIREEKLKEIEKLLDKSKSDLKEIDGTLNEMETLMLFTKPQTKKVNQLLN